MGVGVSGSVCFFFFLDFLKGLDKECYCELVTLIFWRGFDLLSSCQQK